MAEYAVEVYSTLRELYVVEAETEQEAYDTWYAYDPVISEAMDTYKIEVVNID